MFFVYALKSISHNYIYVGISDNVDRRFRQHNAGYEKTTRPYAPFILFHKESFATRELARKREKYLKSGTGKELLKSLLKSQ